MPRGIFFAFAREPDLLAIGSRMTVARLILSHCWLQESRPQNWGEGRQLDRPDACAGSSAPVQEVFSHGIAALQRSEEHTSELQSLMRISYTVFCLKKKK